MQVAAPFGIPLRLHWSFWLLVLGIMAMGLAQQGPAGLLGGLITSSILVVSVVLHEYGHALAARRFGIATHHVTLYPFGGVAAIDHIPEDPDQETVIAFAGPAVNLALAGLGGLVWSYTGHPIAWAIVLMNLLMGLFNLIPAYPMDGGRILRSFLARWMGWMPASKLAVRIGRVFSIGFVVFGVISQNPGFLITGAFLWVALNAEQDRLVAQTWEQATGRPAPWTQGAPGRAESASALVPRL